MVSPSQPTTRLGALVLVAALAACQSKHEIRAAQTSVYDADFAIVYSETLQAVRELYPRLDDNPATGLIATAWHEVRYNANPEDRRSQQQQDRALGSDEQSSANFGGGRSSLGKRNFIRFDVTVKGGRPWKIRVVGKAQEWQSGDAVPSELKGAAIPHWLPGRKDALQVAIYRRLKQYAISVETPEVEVEEPAHTVDLSVFGPIPKDAAEAVAAIVAAIDTRDPAALRALLDDEVVWNLGAPGDADTALAMWQADPENLAALARVLRAGCRDDQSKFVPAVICPPAATESPGYLDWRVTLELTEVGGGAPARWKLTSFVKGD